MVKNERKKRKVISGEQVLEIEKNLIHGLSIEGGHHKQFYLFRILEVVNPKLYKHFMKLVDREVIEIGIED